VLWTAAGTLMATDPETYQGNITLDIPAVGEVFLSVERHDSTIRYACPGTVVQWEDTAHYVYDLEGDFTLLPVKRAARAVTQRLSVLLQQLEDARERSELFATILFRLNLLSNDATSLTHEKVPVTWRGQVNPEHQPSPQEIIRLNRYFHPRHSVPA
jgi:hypothetical protein